MNVKKLAKPADGIIDAKKKVEIIEKEDGTKEYYQYEWKDDPNCKLYKIGLTKEEAENIMAFLA